MKTVYQIRRPDLSGIFIEFDRDFDAINYWHRNIEKLPVTDIRHGAVVVQHDYETEHEAETARLDFLLGEGGIAAFSKACLAAKDLSGNWPEVAREALDIARKARFSSTKVIWPKPEDEAKPAQA